MELISWIEFGLLSLGPNIVVCFETWNLKVKVQNTWFQARLVTGFYAHPTMGMTWYRISHRKYPVKTWPNFTRNLKKPGSNTQLYPELVPTRFNFKFCWPYPVTVPENNRFVHLYLKVESRGVNETEKTEPK